MIKLHKRFLKKLSKLLPLIILTVILGVICLFAMRSNNEHMGKLRSAVYTSDKNNGDVTLALQNLQKYVTHHMNTSLSGGSSVYPPIQLKYTYQRLLDQESDVIANSNASLYTAAQTYCQATVPTAFSGRTRVPCVEQYIEEHDSQLPTIPTALYEFDFISPRWSPDLAGYSLIATILSLVALVVAIIYEFFFKKKA